MELPRQPIDSEFDSEFAYDLALKAWERVCLAIIAAQHVPTGRPETET